MKKWWSLVLAALVLVGTPGCGSQAARQENSVLGDAAGIDAEAVLMTVEGQEVPAWRYLYWLADTCDYIRTYYEAAGKRVDWSESHGGETLAEYARSQTLSTVALYAEVEAWAVQYGCNVTEEDQAELDRDWTALAEQNGGEAAYLQELEEKGIDEEQGREMAKDYELYRRLYDLFTTPESALYPIQEELEQYEKEDQLITIDEILISTADVAEGDTETMQQRRQEAERILEKLNGEADPVAVFATMATAYSDGDREAYPEGFTFAGGTGAVPEEVEAAAEVLGENQISGVVETDEGFCLVLRKPLNQDDVLADYFDHLLQSAAERAKVTYSDAYQTLDVAAFYEKLTAKRGDTAEERPASSAGSGTSGEAAS